LGRDVQKSFRKKEAQLIGLFEPREIRDDVLLKNSFRLNYQCLEQPQFTANTVSLANGGEKSALICLERSLNADAKWNLRQHLKHMFIAF
jgi:hypothetical protein